MGDIEIIYVKPKGFHGSNCEEEGEKIIRPCMKRFARNRARFTEDSDIICLTVDDEEKPPKTRKCKVTTTVDDAWLLEDEEPKEAEIPTHLYGNAAQIMKKMGWNGKALGKEGPLLPLMPTLANSQKRRQGLGFKEPLRKNYRIRR